jgi:hypothetical protein
MQKEDKKGERSGEIVCISLSDWASYRTSGYAFVETDEDGNTPEQQFVAQSTGGVVPRAKANDDDDEGVSMDNTKAEIAAYLDANDIEYDDGSTKAEMLDLI